MPSLAWRQLAACRFLMVSVRSSGDDPCCPTAADTLDAAVNSCPERAPRGLRNRAGFPKNRERGNRQLLHSMWLLKFGQPRQPQRCSHSCRNPRKLDSCAGLSIFRTRLTDAEQGRQFPRLPFPETLFRNAGSHSQWRRYERGRLLARTAWFQATWVCN